MTEKSGRRPVTAREFNRLLFALILLAALTVLARLVTRQESRAQTPDGGQASVAEWLRTADALFVRGEWDMAAEAYFGAVETAVRSGQEYDVRVNAKLAESLYRRGEKRTGIHFLRLYRSQLECIRARRGKPGLAPGDPFLEPGALDEELGQVDVLLQAWSTLN